MLPFSKHCLQLCANNTVVDDFICHRDDIQNNDAVSQYLLRKVWTETQGVCVLCTYRTKSKGAMQTPGNSTPSSVSSRSTRPTSRSSAALTEFIDIPIVEFLTIMDESDTFQRVSLPVLDQAASRSLLTDLFELYNITDVDAGVYDKIYELSGGNALYATELAKGVAQKRIALLDSAAAAVPSLTKLLADIRTVRVEEIVYYRFDQLNSDWQTVLKLAAVASSNGAPFSIPMLDHLLTHDKYFRRKADDEAADLYTIINAMLAANEFIYLKNMSPWVPIVDRGNEYQEFDVEMMQKLFMSWNFVMEQRAIYDLLLDEQKQSLHALMVRLSMYRNTPLLQML
jgi:stress-induced morphogen